MADQPALELSSVGSHLAISSEGVVPAGLHDRAGGVPAWVVVGSPAGWDVLGPPTASEAAGGDWLLEWAGRASLRLSLGRAPVELGIEAPGAICAGLAVAMTAEEGIYGLGERFDRVDQRGSFRRLWVENGSYGDKAYKPVPVAFSSAGHGLAAVTTRAVTISAGSSVAPDRLVVLCDGEVARIVVLTGGSLAELIERYTSWVGRPDVPPRWFFRPWKVGDWTRENQGTVIDDLLKQRELGVRWGAKVIDAHWERVAHDFTFDPVKYPDPTGMFRLAEALDTSLMLWISPAITAGTAAYREAVAAGVLIRDRDGEPYVHDLGNEVGWEGSAIDFTSERAVRWWQDKLRPLVAAGVRGFKTDFGEQLPADCVLADGRLGFEVHNDYPRLYNEATWEVVRPVGGVLLARSAWHGSQRISAIWAGDQSSDYSPWAGLPSAIIAGQTAGISGFPYWGSDVGGYFGSPTADCFARWVEFAAFCPLMELHGLGVREPWHMGDEILRIFLRYATLHASLEEYSLLAAAEARECGMPIIRAMVLVEPGRRHPRWVEYQYCYGSDLLVAPVYSAARRRRVYLPPGPWWSVSRACWQQGPGVVEEDVPLDAIPVFVRAGAMVPVLAEQGVELHVYPRPGVARQVRLLDSSSVSMATTPSGGIQIDGTGSTRSVVVRFHLKKEAHMTVVGISQHEPDGTSGFRFGPGSWHLLTELDDAN